MNTPQFVSLWSVSSSLCRVVFVALMGGALVGWTPTRTTSVRLALHTRAAVSPLSATEAVVLQRMRRWFVRHKLRAPSVDRGLREAALRLAHSLARGRGRTLSHRAVASALWLHGRSDHQIQVFAMAFRKRSQLLQALARELASRIAGKRPNAVGLAVAKGRAQVALLLFVRRGALLAPLQRWWQVGNKVVLRGQLTPGVKRPAVMVGLPHGKVLRPKVRVDSHRRFSATWPARWPGPMEVQVTVSDEQGPWISAQTRLWILDTTADPRVARAQVWRRVRRRVSLRSPPSPRPTRRRSRGWSAAKAAQQLWRVVNRHRKRLRLSTLARDSRLDALAQAHARDMVQENYFAHTSPQHGTFGARFGRLKWSVKLARENIVVAFSPQQAYRYLYESPSHRTNLVEPRFRKTGVGAAIDAKGAIYFVQVFVAP